MTAASIRKFFILFHFPSAYYCFLRRPRKAEADRQGQVGDEAVRLFRKADGGEAQLMIGSSAW